MLGPPTWVGSPEHHAPPGPISQAAAVGALDIFVDGHRYNDVSRMLFGLNLLQDASAAQIEAAIAFMGDHQHLSRADIESMLAG